MNQIILGIDPGTTESGICMIEAKGFYQPNIVSAEKLLNGNVKRIIDETRLKCDRLHVVIEGMANQSRAFGSSSIETCYFVGRLMQFCDSIRISATLYKRHEYGRFFVTSGVLNDSSLRAALETIWGPSAKKAHPLYALRGASDKRSAFALAKYHENSISAWPKW